MSAAGGRGTPIRAVVRTQYVEAACAWGVAISRVRDRLGDDRGDRAFSIAAVAVPGTAVLAWLMRSQGDQAV